MNRMPASSQVAAAFNNNAVGYDKHIMVQKRVVTQLVSVVELHQSRPPERILDVGTGTGALLERLHCRYPHAGLSGVDVALNMCQHARQKLGPACHVVSGAAECLPFKAAAFDLVVSASVLQWVEDLPAALHELRRVVCPGGTIALAFFCEGSLGELQQSLKGAANRCSANSSLWMSRLHEFRKVDEVKSILDKMDFEQFVVTVETEVDWFDNLHSLLRSIKNIGAGSVSGGSGSGLGWRGILQEASRLYEGQFGQNGRIPATYKVLYLLARV